MKRLYWFFVIIIILTETSCFDLYEEKYLNKVYFNPKNYIMTNLGKELNLTKIEIATDDTIIAIQGNWNFKKNKKFNLDSIFFSESNISINTMIYKKAGYYIFIYEGEYYLTGLVEEKDNGKTIRIKDNRH